MNIDDKIVQNEFSRLLAIDLISERPLRREIKANVEERKLLARRFDLLKLDQLEADLTIQYIAAQEIQIKGQLNAIVDEKHVKTLKPVHRNIQRSFSLTLGRHTAAINDEIGQKAGEHYELLKDWLMNGQLDIGEIVVQELSDELDFYPGIHDEV